jgi:hypothetical protein
MAHIVSNHSQLENKAQASSLSKNGVLAAMALSITLLVLGLLGAYSVVQMPAALYTSLLVTGGCLGLFSLISCVKLMCKGRDNMSTLPVEARQPPDCAVQNQLTWEQKIHHADAFLKTNILNALQGKKPKKCRYEKVLFFSSHATLSDIFFEPLDGKLKWLYPEILKTTGTVKIFICPQDEAAESRWAIENWFSLCSSGQPALQEFTKLVCYEVEVLSLSDSHALNNPSKTHLPKTVKKALGI